MCPLHGSQPCTCRFVEDAKELAVLIDLAKNVEQVQEVLRRHHYTTTSLAVTLATILEEKAALETRVVRAEHDVRRLLRERDALRSLCERMEDLITSACPDASTWCDDDGGLWNEYERVMLGVRTGTL